MMQMPQKDGAILPWAEQAAREINGLTASGTPGMLARSGAGGTGFEPLPQNLRDRKPEAVQDRGCFYIKSRTAKEATEATDDADAQPERVEIEFGNQYFMHGGILKHCNFDKYVLTEQGIVSLHLSANGTMAPQLVQHASFSLLTADQVGTLEEYWHPLYEFDADGNVLADFRVIPTIVMGEFL